MMNISGLKDNELHLSVGANVACASIRTCNNEDATIGLVHIWHRVRICNSVGEESGIYAMIVNVESPFLANARMDRRLGLVDDIN